MGAALSVSTRELIVNEKLSGKSLVDISQEQSLSYATTCLIWRRFKSKGFEGLAPDYQNCGPRQIKSSALIHRCSLYLKRKYPFWGAPVIRTILSERYPAEKLPSVRSLQVWFKRAGLSKPKFHREKARDIQAERVHDCWQLDSKEYITLADGSKACYLTSVDVKSGALLAAQVFPQRKDQPSQPEANPSKSTCTL